MTGQPQDRPAAPTGAPLWRQLLAPVAVLAVLVVAGRLLGARWPEIESAIAGMGIRGRGLFVVVTGILAAGCFPIAGLSLSAGALFGPWLGLALVASGGFLGSALMYVLARGMLRARIREAVAGNARLAALDRLVGERAVRLNLLTRLSPLNFGLACYTLAAGRSGGRAYAVGVLGAVPGMAAYAWLGFLARRAGGGVGDGQRLLMLAVGIGFSVLLGWLLTRMVRRAWREAGAAAGDSTGAGVGAGADSRDGKDTTTEQP
jgi:uncharacterized membrane protein YdjX (TVP38/TMEM64 family)